VRPATCHVNGGTNKRNRDRSGLVGPCLLPRTPQLAVVAVPPREQASDLEDHGAEMSPTPDFFYPLFGGYPLIL
jgi:hypothetical protein